MLRQDDGEPLGAPGPDHALDPAGIDPEHIVVEEEDGAEGLALGTGGYLSDHRGVGQEGVDLGGAHFVRVPLLVEEDEAAAPVVVGVFVVRA